MSREKVLELSDQKGKLEKEIQSLVEYLTSPGMPGLKGSLVDSEGFPLPGLDLYSIRSARQRYNALNNDYTNLMHQIEAELHSYFGSPQSVNHIAPQSIPVKIEIPLNDSPVAFAEITEVSQDSPAFNAGFYVGDKIVGFGPINYTNHHELAALANFVRQNEGNEIIASVLRGPENVRVSVSITPRKWSGNGIIGCRFRPIS